MKLSGGVTVDMIAKPQNTIEPDSSQSFAGEYFFGEPWADRHNQELWHMTGGFDDAPEPSPPGPPSR
jgi:hypothetical protein